MNTHPPVMAQRLTVVRLLRWLWVPDSLALLGFRNDKGKVVSIAAAAASIFPLEEHAEARFALRRIAGARLQAFGDVEIDRHAA